MTEASKTDGTVGKALALLDEVAAIGRPVRFTELLSKSTYPKATLYRLLQTLTNQAMLGYDPDRQEYSLGVRLVRLAHTAWQQSSLAPIARPFVDELSGKVGETVHLSQLDNGQVLYVDKRNAASPIEMFSQAGKVGPGYCTGVGKVMMAFLDKKQQDRAIGQQAFLAYTDNTLTTPVALRKELEEIREAGISFDREEHEPHIICIAAPILTSSGRVVGGLSITSSTQRHSLADLEKLKPELLAAAHQIGEAAVSWHFPENRN
ncbi:MAG: IclR family transcriptional regulator [Paracoccaceae bacterium]